MNCCDVLMLLPGAGDVGAAIAAHPKLAGIAFTGSTATAQAIRAQIREETALTASAGVAPNKFLAKIASDWRKPDGIYVVKPAMVADFLAPLPVGKIPGVGSYFSNQDYIGGGQVFFGPPLPPVLVTDNSKDQRPGDSGQFGGQLRWSPAGSDYEFGFYAARYHDKTPAVPVFDLVNGNVHQVYAEGIKTVGASVTSSIGQLNWALEGSVRTDAPLANDPAVLGGAPFMPPLNCSGSASNPCYATGKTAHLNLSGIYVLNKSSLWDGGALVAELAWNRVMSVDKNPSAVGFGGLDPNTTRSAMAFRMIFEPQYFQVLPGLDLSIPIGLGYNFGGRSSAIFNFAGGASKAGDVSVGVKARYQNAWNVGLNYTAFFGKENTFTVADPRTPTRMLSFGQTLKDRDYLSFNVSRTF